MNNRSNIRTPRYISPSNLILRAPKYVHRLERLETSARFLKAFKAVKTLTCIPEGIYLEPCHYKREVCIQEVLFKHSKTCRKRDNGGFGLDFDRIYDTYPYKNYQGRLASRFFGRQITWDKYNLCIFYKYNLYLKQFQTKRCVQKLFVDLCFSIEEGFSLDFSSLARHLTVLKGLEVLNIRISSFDCEGLPFKFLRLLNKISPLIWPETKISLVLFFACQSNSSKYFQMLGLLPNILHRITHLKIWFRSFGETQFKSFVDFTCLLSRLRSLELDTDQMGHFHYTEIEYLLDNLAAVNGSLQTLKICFRMRWPSQNDQFPKTIDLRKYTHFLSRLKVLSIYVPILSSSTNLDMKLFLNQHIKTDHVEIIRNIAYRDGFLLFIRKFKPDTTESSVFAEIKDHTLFIDIKHFQVKDKAWARKYGFERVNTSIDPSHFERRCYGDSLSELAINKIFRFIYKMDFCLSENSYNLIERTLALSAKKVQMLIIRYEGHDRLWEEDDQYTISNFYYFDLKEDRTPNKIYEEYVYEEEPEEDYTEEMIQISYLENRKRPTERKNNRKIFVE